jgi:xanthine dehydrogenase YagR molybdenum-binding subunit
MPKASRQESVIFGIDCTGLGHAERRIGADQPPALAPNARLSAIGKRIPRIDGVAKVTGAARYTVDLKLPGMLFARLLRSPYPQARVVAIDTSAAERHPAVRALHLGAAADAAVDAGDIPTLSYVGAIVAGVAATSRAAADEALALIKVEYEPLPFVVDMAKAREPGAPLVREIEPAEPESGAGSPGNLRGPSESPFGGARGDVEQGLRDAEIVVEGVFQTQVQSHSCLEPHAVLADWRPDGLTVYLSTQDVSGSCSEIAAAFGLPDDKVRIVCDFMGGGFGSKLSPGEVALVAIALSRKAGAPVLLAFDRHEEQTAGGNRPGTWQQLTIGAKRDGTLTAISLLSYGTAGVARGAGVGNIAQAMYQCPNFAAAQYDVLTNAAPGCPMRAPGNVQGAFALEQLVDDLAETLGLDPLVLRDRIDRSAARREERRIGAERIGWSARHPAGTDQGPVKCGIGMAQSSWPGIVQSSGSCEVRIRRDGSVELRSAVQDIGTGTSTVLAQTVAEELGLAPGDIFVRIGHSEYPTGVSSGGSKATGSVTPAARKAAFAVGKELLRQIAPALNASPAELQFGGGRVFRRDDPSRGMGFAEAAARLHQEEISAKARRGEDYTGFRARTPFGGLARADIGGVQFAVVAVDTETGVVRVERVVAVHDCGRPINPLLIESQIHGGVIMGLSYALLEERFIDPGTGHVVNADLDRYKIARACGSPAVEVVLIENYLGQSATDACGVAEPATIPTAAAIANAVYNAIGVRLRKLPMNPAAVLAALGKVPSGP